MITMAACKACGGTGWVTLARYPGAPRDFCRSCNGTGKK